MESELNVQSIAGCKQVCEGGYQRDRDGQDDDKRRSPSSEKHEHHQHNDDEGDENGLLQAVDRIQDVSGGIQNYP